MICPHCLIAFKVEWNENDSNPIYDKVDDLRFYFFYSTCPECEREIIKMLVEEIQQSTHWGFKKEMYLHPKTPNRKPLPKSIPKKFTKDYYEANAVISDSPNASAALSRRVLQHILEEKSNVTKNNRLVDQIKEAKEKEKFDLKLHGLIDYVRTFGNFGTHASKDDSDKIIDVEKGEAETLLEIIEDLFDYYYLKPEELNKTKKRLDEKRKKKSKS